MKILAVADDESKFLWDHYREVLQEVDLILSCGDLKPEYLSFLVTFSKSPLFYVHGNHDDNYSTHEPEGCECIEDRVVTYKGIRILGLGGSQRYKEGKHQYTDQQMKRRVSRVQGQIRRAGGIDILLSHAPALGVGDGEDRVHKGFEAFNELMDRYTPAYMIHGHLHAGYTHKFQRVRQYNQTQVINAYERYIIEI